MGMILIINTFFISFNILPFKLILEDINNKYPMKGNIISRPPKELLLKLHKIKETPRI